ncbi:uncharacterized protein [Dysidea avara]|uniref:uncharacterized protein n=1 Tax=Dysidea avara TaxID=196820 RepID=UPI00331C2F8E
MGNRIQRSNTISYIQQTVKARLEESEYTPHRDSDVRVVVIIATYLRSETYKYHVAVCSGLPTLVTNIEQIQTKDAQQVATAFKSIWKSNHFTTTFPFPPYVNIQSNYEGTLQLHSKNHECLRKELLGLLKLEVAPMCLYLPLVQLLSLAYWLVLFYNRNRDDIDNYNQHLHGFLSDFVVTFITLLSTLFPQSHSVAPCCLRNLPGVLQFTNQPLAAQPVIDAQYHRMNMADSTMIAHIKSIIQTRFRESNHPPSENSDTKVDTVIKMYLLNTSYKGHITACTLSRLRNKAALPTEAINLKRLKRDDAVRVVEAFKTIWEENLSTVIMPGYVSIQQRYGQLELQEHIKNHTAIRYQLIELLRHEETSQHLYLPLVQLLSLSYWLALYYDNIRQHQCNDIQSKYNEHLHYFLQDFTIIFILLLSEAFPQNHFLKNTADNTFPHNTTNEKICYMQQTIKTRLELSGHTPSSAVVETAITVYLLSTTYKYYVTAITGQAINLEHLHTKDAEEVAKAFQSIWKEKLDIEEEPCYIDIQNSVDIYTKRLLLYTNKHIEIREQLMKLLDKQSQMHLYVPLVQLLSLAYWLVLYYDKIKGHIKKKERKKYNKHLHSFLSDFVVTFVLLISKLFPQNYTFVLHNRCDLAGIVKTTVRIKKFPENPIFRELVLLEMANILDVPARNPEGTVSDRIETLAQSVKAYLQNAANWVAWHTRNTGFFLKVISDQSRYMVHCQNRNFVANRNMVQVVNAIKYLHNEPILNIEDILEQENQQAIHQVAQNITLHHLPQNATLHHLPQNGPLPDRSSDMDTKYINDFYHIAFIGIIWHTVGNCPRVLRTGRIDVRNYTQFCRELAKTVIDDAEQIDDRNNFIATVTRTLREIIAARCCLSDDNHIEGIVSDSAHRTHRDILIYFIAFRVLLLCLLPQDLNQFGEQRVARTLPLYAKNNSIFI